jgi:Holliday junction resolvasome RuvABC endonuclease subunit
VRILGLDPGEETGYGCIDVADKVLTVVEYGVIPITKPGLEGLLQNTWAWLNNSAPKWLDAACFEEFIIAPKMRTTKESTEVRAIIRLWATINQIGVAYYPATVRAQTGCKNKVAIRKWVEDTLGFKVRGKDHVPDALSIAMCHAIKLGLWYPTGLNQPDFSLTRKLGGKQTKSPQTVEEVAKMSATELGDALKAGKIKVGRQ